MLENTLDIFPRGVQLGIELDQFTIFWEIDALISKVAVSFWHPTKNKENIIFKMFYSLCNPLLPMSRSFHPTILLPILQLLTSERVSSTYPSIQGHHLWEATGILSHWGQTKLPRSKNIFYGQTTYFCDVSNISCLGPDEIQPVHVRKGIDLVSVFSLIVASDCENTKISG